MFSFMRQSKKRNSPARKHSIQTSLDGSSPGENEFKPELVTNPRQINVASAQSVGMLRDHNEDALFTFSTVLAMNQFEERFGLFALADGMGGHMNGEVASDVSVRVAVNYLIQHLFEPLISKKNEPMNKGIHEILNEAFQEAQIAVLEGAPGGGTTLLVAILMNDMVTISHVGDSRAYFFHPDGHLEKLTSDHSLVQRLIDLKEITEQEAENHPQKNVLLKAVGQTDPFEPDIQTIRVPDGVKLMLCSDGLWGVVPEKIVQEVLAENKPLYETCQELVSAANQFGGPDNISVILVQTV